MNQQQALSRSDDATLPGARPKEIEELLAELWERVLERGPARPDSNILELKVGVRRVYRLLEEIGRITGLDLPISVVFNAPTLQALIEIVRSRRVPPFTPLALVRSGQGHPPLFLAPGIGGVALELCDLARLIVHPGPVYIMQPKGLDGKDPPLRRAEEMAEYHLEAIRQVQPHGPYLLCGYSWGAVVTMEIARRLMAEGETVGLLAVIEPQLSEAVWPTAARVNFLMRRCRYHIETLRSLPLKQALTHLGGRLRPLTARIGRLSGVGKVQWSPYSILDLPAPLFNVREASIEAFYAYRPELFDCAVTFFKSKSGDPLLCDQLKVWPKFLRKPVVHHVSGDHSGMVREPVVNVIALEISRLLTQQASSHHS